MKMIRKKRKDKCKGYTLVELVTVITIIAILASSLFLGAATIVKQARMTKAKSDLSLYAKYTQDALFNNPSWSQLEISKRISVEDEAYLGGYLTNDLKFTGEESALIDSWGTPYNGYYVYDESDHINDCAFIFTSNGPDREATKKYTYGDIISGGRICISGDLFSEEANNDDILLVVYLDAMGGVESGIITEGDDRFSIYKIDYDANGGTGTPESQEKKYGDEIIISTLIPVRTGYTFGGWNTLKDGNGTLYASGSIYAENGNATLYAKWIPNTYKLEYELYGGIIRKDNPTSYNIETETFTLNNPEKQGYDFVGWSSLSDTLPNTSVTIMKGSMGHKAYTANWTPRDDTPYKVVHWQQKTTGIATEYNAENYEKIVEETLRGTTDTTFIVEPKSFTGFKMPTAQSITIVADGSAVLNYYYTRISYTLTLNADTGIDGDSIQGAGTYLYGADVQIDATPLIGYTWSRWTGYNDTTEKIYKFIMPAQDVTDTATVTANNYTVRFNANTGLGTMSDEVFKYDEQKQLTANAFIKEGYDLVGWSKTPTGNVIYNDKQSVKNLSSEDGALINLYAQWKLKTYKITYNGNGGSNVPSSGTKDYGATYTVSYTTPTRAGHTFDCWRGSDGGVYYAGSSYSTNENLTLTAQWTPYSYIVSYAANGGSGAPGSQEKDYGVTLTLRSTIPTRNGYTFSHWSGNDNGTYRPGGSFSGNYDLTLTAQWTEITYYISYNLNGGSGSFQTQSKKYGETKYLYSQGPTKSGFLFTGWIGNGSSYSKGSPYTANASVTMYAQWKAATPTRISVYRAQNDTQVQVKGGNSQTLADYQLSLEGLIISVEYNNGEHKNVQYANNNIVAATTIWYAIPKPNPTSVKITYKGCTAYISVRVIPSGSTS